MGSLVVSKYRKYSNFLYDFAIEGFNFGCIHGRRLFILVRRFGDVFVVDQFIQRMKHKQVVSILRNPPGVTGFVRPSNIFNTSTSSSVGYIPHRRSTSAWRLTACQCHSVTGIVQLCHTSCANCRLSWFITRCCHNKAVRKVVCRLLEFILVPPF